MPFSRMTRNDLVTFKCLDKANLRITLPFSTPEQNVAERKMLHYIPYDGAAHIHLDWFEI